MNLIKLKASREAEALKEQKRKTKAAEEMKRNATVKLYSPSR
jgi:hypothetical protein